MDLPSLPLIILDTETTGLLPRVNRVIEFASVRLEDGKIVEEYEQLFSISDEQIPPHVCALTRIEDKDLEGKPTFEEKRGEVLGRISEDSIIVGQNVSFDIGMLKGEGIDLSKRPWIDTSMIASLVFPELESYSLGYLSTVLNLNHEPVHRALGDVHATIELLSKCWTRLGELSATERDAMEAILPRCPEAYKKLFQALPEPAKATPKWLKMPKSKIKPPKVDPTKDSVIAGTTTDKVQLIEEPLNPTFLQNVINDCARSKEGNYWIGVKNLHATISRVALPKNLRVAHYPARILDHGAVAEFAAQESFTADEATLALKLVWYEPKLYSDLPIHGNEKPIWNGKLACTVESKEYQEQFKDIPSIVLLDHMQLLSILEKEEHPARTALSPDAHIIIDDASMLEDTATKAYGRYCTLDDIRASAEGDESLTKFADVLQLWIEKTRSDQDVHYLAPSDLGTPDVRGLRDQLDDILESHLQKISPVRSQMEDLKLILDSKNLGGRIAWIERRQDGGQYIQSVPEHLSPILKDNLFDPYAATLLIPPKSAETLGEILPPRMEKTLDSLHRKLSVNVPTTFDDSKSVDDILNSPPTGKTVIILNSRRRIEESFVKFAVQLEKKGITMICQGLSGGMGRMQADFSAAKGDAVWLITPWTFENIEVPFESIDHLVLETLPFDHPSHTVLSRRANHYQNAFEDYSLPRLMHRLYRILRVFSRYRSKEAGVLVLDQRLETKSYGKTVWKYLKEITEMKGVQGTEKKSDAKTTSKSESEDQLKLFE